MMQNATKEKIILGFVDEVIKRDMILKKINKDELKQFVNSDGKLVTIKFKESMKKLHAALDNS